MIESLAAAIAAALEERIVSTHSLSGGDINEAYRLQLASGRSVFAKCNHAPHAQEMFDAEAQGIAWLIGFGAPMPRTLAQVATTEGAALVLEYVAPGQPDKNAWSALGAVLAKLHQHTLPSLHSPMPSYLATLQQDNGPVYDWPSRYVDKRLQPQISRAVESGALPPQWTDDLERARPRLLDALSHDEPPAPLHGDLWTGNLLFARDGQPWLIDPAAYAGDREVDLAMLQLFGAPPPAFWQAYDAHYPRRHNYRERIDLYQLYPLLVHVNLFGGGYASSARSALARYL